jgi:hypothetical protein
MSITLAAAFVLSWLICELSRLKLGCSESHLIAGAAAETLNKPSRS